uniref:HAD family hydrolase n=1 Tax=candidate division WOR-3 bacterium TaxID=2052148 RepID=A0A7C4CA09_UNCW3
MTDLSRIRAVLFDLFHTLVSLQVSQAPGPSTAELLGTDNETWWRVWTHDSDRYTLGLARLEEILPAKARIANPAVTAGQIQEALISRPARFRHALINVEPETLAGLGRLRAAGLKIGLITNCGADEVSAWPESPLAPLFHATVFSCREGLRKPDPRIYRLAADRLGLEPAACLFTGDGASDEFTGARQAGMTPVLITRHLEVMAPERIASAEPLAAFRVSTVSALADLLCPAPSPP